VFVETLRPLEKVAVDMIDIRTEGKYVLVAIDYFTRGIKAAVLESKATRGVVETIKAWIGEGFRMEELISDNGKEFCSREFGEMCVDFGIKHRKVGVESHRSNGRVERVIGTIREALVKDTEGELGDRIERIVGTYNNTYHGAIGCTPVEAWENECGNVMVENSSVGK
jgi:transposase InsO family protein